MALRADEMVTSSLRLVRPLGEGGMGTVWVAEHLGLKTEVALKFVHAHRANEDSFERFSREASVAAQLKHPHVVQILDHGLTDDGDAFIAMELLEGESLEERLEREVLTIEEAGLVLSQTAKALGKAHKRGVIHRDLKPANLFLQESGYAIFVKILDFGIAKQADDDEDVRLTDSAAVMGTPIYMSPEAMRGRARDDPRVDLWALVVMTYEALTGQLPFQGSSFGDLTVLVHEGAYEPPSKANPELPPALDAWFERALQRDPDDRFQSLDELVEAYREATSSSAASGADTPAPSVRGDATHASPKRKSTTQRMNTATATSTDVAGVPKSQPRWWLAAVAVVAAGGLLFAYTQSSSLEEQPTPAAPPSSVASTAIDVPVPSTAPVISATASTLPADAAPSVTSTAPPVPLPRRAPKSAAPKPKPPSKPVIDDPEWLRWQKATEASKKKDSKP